MQHSSNILQPDGFVPGIQGCFSIENGSDPLHSHWDFREC